MVAAQKTIPPPADVKARAGRRQENGERPRLQGAHAGHGRAASQRARSQVTVHYTGWTTDGKMFDSSVARGEPATFPLDGVIPGWTEGVQLMVEGEKTRFWIPETLAYKGQQRAVRACSCSTSSCSRSSRARGCRPGAVARDATYRPGARPVHPPCPSWHAVALA